MILGLISSIAATESVAMLIEGSALAAKKPATK